LGREGVPALSSEASRLLEVHAWPGNVRELRNVIERAVVLCDGDTILPEHLPPKLPGPAPAPFVDPSLDPAERLRIELEALERRRTVAGLARCGGNQTQAAELLGISRRTLVSRLAAYDLQRRRKRPAE